MKNDIVEVDPREDVKTAIEQAIASEKAYAESKFPKYTSHHEAYAILLEEVEETAAEFKKLSKGAGEYWAAIKANSSGVIKGQLPEIFDITIKLSHETIQIAAVILRIRDMVKELADDPAAADLDQQKIPMPDKK